MSFNREYFGNDPEGIEIFQNRSREEMVPQLNHLNNNQNNNHINQNLNPINSVQSNRIIRNLYNNINSSNSNVLNHNDNQLNIFSDNSNNFFIFLFKPNKITCLLLLFLNIVVSGLGTLLIGFKNCSLYDFLLGIIQFFGCYLSFLKGLDIQKTRYIYNIKINSFLGIYLIILSLLLYLSSIYIGIFHNFIFFNPRRIKMNENKEKGICIIILNFMTGGLGTLFYGILIRNSDFFNRIKNCLVGLVQICGFIIFILAFSLISQINIIILIILFFIGAVGYITSIIIGIKCYEIINIS